jgi:hypothetical protein
MSSTKNTPPINTTQALGEIKQWNLENDQKNADLTAVKAKATEEYLAQAVNIYTK